MWSILIELFHHKLRHPINFRLQLSDLKGMELHLLSKLDSLFLNLLHLRVLFAQIFHIEAQLIKQHLFAVQLIVMALYLPILR